MQHDPGILSIAVLALVASSVWVLAETDEKGFVRITPKKSIGRAPLVPVRPLCIPRWRSIRARHLRSAREIPAQRIHEAALARRGPSHRSAERHLVHGHGQGDEWSIDTTA